MPRHSGGPRSDHASWQPVGPPAVRRVHARSHDKNSLARSQAMSHVDAPAPAITRHMADGYIEDSAGLAEETGLGPGVLRAAELKDADTAPFVKQKSYHSPVRRSRGRRREAGSTTVCSVGASPICEPSAPTNYLSFSSGDFSDPSSSSPRGNGSRDVCR